MFKLVFRTTARRTTLYLLCLLVGGGSERFIEDSHEAMFKTQGYAISPKLFRVTESTAKAVWFDLIKAPFL